MQTDYLLDKVGELKEKFKSFFQHRKKIAALENFSVTDRFSHRNYLMLVKTCMNEGFLGHQESDFLDYMLNRYELNYLDWSHKTKWLKSEMRSRQSTKPVPAQRYFSFERKESPVHVPLEILATINTQRGARI